MILDENATPAAFRTAMDAVQVGGTVKITGENRHPNADALLLDNLDLTGATIVDIGASDGSTSVDLIRKLPAFKSYVIADLFLTIDVLSALRHEFFYDQDGECVLVCGPRCVAWPTRSKLIRFLYAPLIGYAARRSAQRQAVLLLNPSTRALMAADPRVTNVVHDVFKPWPKPAPDLIKVANLLGPYFSDEVIAQALQALLESLEEGGHLLIVDNGKITGAEPRAGLYKRADARFILIGQTNRIPDIDPIIRAARVDAESAA